MEIIEAIRARHSVRKYEARPLEEATVAALLDAIRQCNAEGGLHIQLVLNEPRAFAAGILKYGAFSGVTNYLVMAAPKGAAYEEKIGYYGEKLVLLAQTLGLNTCWVGLTYKKIPGTFTLTGDEIVHCVISIGYGANAGAQHPMRPLERFYEAEGEAPDWLLAGVEAAVLAPTAINQQKFKFFLRDGNKVEAKTLYSLAGYTNVDLGIVKYHFEIGAGKDHFEWI